MEMKRWDGKGLGTRLAFCYDLRMDRDYNSEIQKQEAQLWQRDRTTLHVVANFGKLL